MLPSTNELLKQTNIKPKLAKTGHYSSLTQKLIFLLQYETK